MNISRKTLQEKICCLIILTFSISAFSSSFSYSQGNTADEVQPSTPSAIVPAETITPATTAVQPAEGTGQGAAAAEPADDKQLLNAIADLDYKIEYLKSGYSRLNADIENLKIADRDHQKLLNDRISAIPVPDTSKIDNLSAESEHISSELTQVKAEISDIKAKLDQRAQATGDWRDDADKILHSPWLAVAAIGLSLIALAKH